jgi:U1 small nuclear ribonucleoprotein 70kDa
MTDKLPQNLRALFAPRPPLRFLPAHDHPLDDRRTTRISGVAEYLPLLAEKAENARKSNKGELVEGDPGWEAPPTLSELEKRDNAAVAKREHQQWLVTEGVKKLFNPNEDPTVRGDPFKTLFIARLAYDAEVRDLEAAFQRFGTIERIRIVSDNGTKWKEMKERGINMKNVSKKRKEGASRGYAFIVFERESDMKGSCELC